MTDEKVWNEERVGWDVEGPCWSCGSRIAYFVDEDGTPRDIRPIPPAIDPDDLAGALSIAEPLWPDWSGYAAAIIAAWPDD